MPVQIRDEVPNDIPAIASVVSEAFRSAAHASGTEPLIVNALRERGRLSISLVAMEGNQVVGHVAVSPVEISDGSEGWFGLGPIAVLPAWQGKGVGSLLMNAALDALRRQRARGCVVLGEPGYYGRFGFVSRADLVLPDVPQEYFQAVRFDGEWPAGTVQYDEAFWVTG
ncbi:N-acetyltransferase [Cupriavidus gilardii]|uniref:GNAT family N-acetyltransferase n=1 Tax=Cupriavidus gilardii TaxID=82541 RepID=UPI0015726823|nr:N-acetyltransferase [Cupriavidus gilardii]MCG5262183.1 N-acetyltransferase [Cupriavidus gilardii]MDF9430314.1 N-acetyltransferase [Cupriavidus gilardii]NSX03037.1 N-acetyltransferase [Cupriavidus gilardii]